MGAMVHSHRHRTWQVLSDQVFRIIDAQIRQPTPERGLFPHYALFRDLTPSISARHSPWLQTSAECRLIYPPRLREA